MSSSLVSRATLETIASWAEVFTVLFTMLGAACGVAYVAANRPLKKLQEKESLEEKQATARAQADAARAQLELKKYVEQVEKQSLPRFFRFEPNVLLNRLKGKPKATVRLLYNPNDTEAFLFASQLRRWLGPGENGDGAGWKVSAPMPLSNELPALPQRPPAARFGGAGTTLGITVISRGTAAMGSTASDLMDGLALSLGGGSLVGEGDERLPENTFIIVIGQRP